MVGDFIFEARWYFLTEAMMFIQRAQRACCHLFWEGGGGTWQHGKRDGAAQPNVDDGVHGVPTKIPIAGKSAPTQGQVVLRRTN